MLAPVRPVSSGSLVANGKNPSPAGLQPVRPAAATSLLTGHGNALQSVTPVGAASLTRGYGPSNSGGGLQSVSPVGAASLTSWEGQQWGTPRERLQQTLPVGAASLAGIPPPPRSQAAAIQSMMARAGKVVYPKGALRPPTPPAAPAAAASPPMADAEDAAPASAPSGHLERMEENLLKSQTAAMSALASETGAPKTSGGLAPVRAVGVASLISGDNFSVEQVLHSVEVTAPAAAEGPPKDDVTMEDPGKPAEEATVEKEGEPQPVASDPYLEAAPTEPPAPAVAATSTAISAIDTPVESKASDAATTELLSEVAKNNKSHIFLSSTPGVGKTTMVQKLLAKLREDEGHDAIDIDGFVTEEMRDTAGLRAGFDVVRVKGLGRSDRCSIARLGQKQPKVGKYSIDVDAFEYFAIPTIRGPIEDQIVELPEKPKLYKKGTDDEELVSVQLEGVEVGTGEEGAACIVKVMSSGKELIVIDPSLLEPVPSGWKPRPKEPPSKKPRLCVCDEVGKMELLSTKFPPILLNALDGKAVMFGTLPEQQQKAVRDHHVVADIKKRKDVKVVRLTRNNRDDLVPKVYSWLRESLGLPPASAKKKAEAAAAAGASSSAAKASDSPAEKKVDASAQAQKSEDLKGQGAAASSSPPATPANSTPAGSPTPAASPPPTPMGSPSPAASPGPDEDDAKDDKKDKKAEKKDKKAAKREAERIEGLKRAEERKKRKEAAAAGEQEAAATAAAAAQDDAAKREADRLEGIRRAEERKKRREAAAAGEQKAAQDEAAKREADRLEGIRRAEERKKRREAAAAANAQQKE